MTPASLSFAAKGWLWPAAALFVVGLLLIYRSYSGTSLPRKIGVASAALKAAGLALILSFLLEPTWTTTRPREGANLFAVVVDNSMGLEVLASAARGIIFGQAIYF